MPNPRRSFIAVALALALGGNTLALAIGGNAQAATELLNVSYDPTRELYQEYNAAFAKYWKTKNNETVTINAVPWWLWQARPAR
jgi:ABC-type sulfate transport system substrate-binding protein